MMNPKLKRITVFLTASAAFIGLSVALFTIFFDQAVLVRKGTIYRGDGSRKVVALTFDDGPSPEWTPKVLDELRKAGVKATFFMIGSHVKEYPDIARRVVREGHEIENHTYTHHVLLYYTTDELEREIKETEEIIKNTTGKSTRFFRPPKAWLTDREKKKIDSMGYRVILWTLNSKDWVSFDDKFIIRYILHNVKPGDILLFHDSGGVLATEGGKRDETVQTIVPLVDKLKAKGYTFVTVSELLHAKE